MIDGFFFRFVREWRFFSPSSFLPSFFILCQFFFKKNFKLDPLCGGLSSRGFKIAPGWGDEEGPYGPYLPPCYPRGTYLLEYTQEHKEAQGMGKDHPILEGEEEKTSPDWLFAYRLVLQKREVGRNGWIVDPSLNNTSRHGRRRLGTERKDVACPALSVRESGGVRSTEYVGGFWMHLL